MTRIFDGLQWDYGCADDVLSAWIGTPQPSDEVGVHEDIVVRISRETHQPVRIDVRSASKRSTWTGALNGAVARALLDQHGPVAMALWRARRGDSAGGTIALLSRPRIGV